MKDFKDEGVWPDFYGSYHMYHRIDDRLVCVTVIDITEKTFNSGFCYYDPAFSFLSLGHVSAIWELEYMNMIRENYNHELKYYYMGHYVANCPKILYKKDLKP